MFKNKNKTTSIQTKFSSLKSKYSWESTALHWRIEVLYCTDAVLHSHSAFLLFIYSIYPMHVIFLSLCMLETVVSVNDMKKTFTGQTATINNCKYCHVVSITGNKFSGSPQIFLIFQYLWIFYTIFHKMMKLQKWKWNRSHTGSNFLPVIQSFGLFDCSWPDDGAVWAFSSGTHGFLTQVIISNDLNTYANPVNL